MPWGSPRRARSVRAIETGRVAWPTRACFHAKKACRKPSAGWQASRDRRMVPHAALPQGW